MFEDLTMLEIIQMLLPLLLLELALKLYCLVLIAKNEVNHLPKWAWSLIVLLVSTFGPIAFLFAGRKRY